jgi:hypothetical protein
MAKTKKKYNTRTLPFEEAKRYVQKYAKTKSRGQYHKWYDEERPKFLPKYPFRAYPDEWVSWNDWNGTTNSFGPIEGDYCTYWEAVRFVQPLGLQSAEEWKEYANSDKRPEDIPKYPEQYYEEWKGRGWDVFLGKSIHSKLTAAKNADPILALLHKAGDPPNVIMISVIKEGTKKLIELQDKKHFTILKVFVYEEELMEQTNQIINATSSPFEGDEKIRLTPNVNEMMWQLSNLLLIKRI